ncbi:hypothetical protein BGZ83_008231 [Gryganskiella cystojenkinii]|nr:hypothetical protein BGZ83_008231 [Gryganskiella cystojenkinii]
MDFAKVSGGDVGEEFLKNATDVFLNFLVKFRKDALSRKDYGPAAQATDTALLGIWVDNRDAPNLLHLIESKNCCKEAISEQKLKISEQHYALSIWYKTHKKYGDTLSIWKGLLQGTLIDSDSKISLQDMASLLMSLQDMNLVEDYGWWIVGQDESIGLKVFMPGDAKRAAMFDSDRIFARCRTDLSPEGTMSYLEYIVGQRKSEVMDRFKTEQEDRLFALALPSKTTAKNSQEQIPSTFLSFLASLMKSDPIANTRVKLCNVLQSSTLYDPKAILAKMEPKELLQSEKAIVLARMSEFEPALAILVNKVKDYQGAETFCLHAGSFQATKRLQKLANQETSKSLSSGDKIVNDEVRKTMFMALLKEYLGMDHHKGGMKLALRLLNSQSTFLHISEVIDLLPQYWSVEMLQEYLLRSLRRGYHQRKELQVVKSLCLSENLRISHELYQLYDQQGPVVITADEVCPLANYSLAYKRIKNAAFEGSGGGGTSTVLFFVAANVDAICAFRIWTTLLKSDSISYVVVPVTGMHDVKTEVKNMSQSIRSVVMLNCGGIFNLEDYIELSEEVTIYVLDSHRPVNLRNAFWNNEVIVFHETDLDKDLMAEKEALLFTEENEYSPRGDDDRSDRDDSDQDDEAEDEDAHRRQRRRTGHDSEISVDSVNKKWKESQSILVDYMSKGLVYGASVANQCYTMASQLDRTTLDILWLAIVGLTSQYLCEQISHRDYGQAVQGLKDESERLTPKSTEAVARNNGIDAVTTVEISAPEEGTIRCTDEFRFMMVRHWSLYDSMYHSNYVASRLGIWREPGRKRLLALLAKMGFSLEECHQVFAHMSIDLKKILKDRIQLVAPEYGLHEILYQSFTRALGYQGSMSASDVAYAVSSLLELTPESAVALGYRPEWIAEENKDNNDGDNHNEGGTAEDQGGSSSGSRSNWWHANFYKACDSLGGAGAMLGGSTEGNYLKRGLEISMKIQKAIVRQAIAVIEKQLITSLSKHRFAILENGPDLPVFWNPLTLDKLAQFLVYAIREYGSARANHRQMPLIVMVFKEDTRTYIATGVVGSPVLGEVKPNTFGTIFEKLAYNDKLAIRSLGFSRTVVEVDESDHMQVAKMAGKYLR